MTALQIVLCALGLIGTGVLLVGAICYAHHRGDAEIGVSDTQGRETGALSGEHGAEKI